METILNREALLKKEKPEVVKVVLGKDEYVYVRQMTGREKDNFEQSLRKEIKNNKGVIEGYEVALNDFRAKLAVVTLCNAEGVLLLKPEDYTLLSMNMLAATLEKIVTAAQKLNAITEEDKEALVLNSKADPEDNSNSVSADN